MNERPVTALLKQIEAMTAGEHRLVLVSPDGSYGPSIDVVLIRGQAARPLIVIAAGVHGDEYDGIYASAILKENINSTALGGSLIVVPIVNRQAFDAQQRRTPVDGMDLNRAFPGNPAGSYTERLADLFFTSIVSEADFVLSLHGWFQTGCVMDYAEIPERSSPLHAQCAAVAAAAGFAFIRDLGWGPGRLGAAVAQRGIPIIEAEVGGSGIFDPDGGRRYLTFLHKAIACIAGEGDREAAAADGRTRFFTSQISIRAVASGLWFRRCDEGCEVEANVLIGEITRISSLEKLLVSAPIAGMIGAVRKRAAVSLGDELAWFFTGFNAG